MATNNGINNKARQLTILPTTTSAGNAGELRLRELAANGTNYTGFKAPDSLSSDIPYTLPSSYPASNGQVLSSTTAGVMSWVSQSSGGSAIGNNVIINPEMVFAQRGTSFASLTSANTYTLDRWVYSKTGTMVYTASQETDVPTVAAASYLFRNSYKLIVTTAQTSIGSGDSNALVQRVEGYNWATIAQRAVTLSFWVKASLTGTYCVSLVNSGTDRSYVAEYTINSANTWEQKTITISASPSAGTWNYTNGIGIYLYFTLSVGSTFQTTANAWQTGAFYGTSNQVNHAATLNNTFFLTGVKLESGSSATAYIGRDFTTETELCQRYYQKTFNLTTTPASNTEVGLRASGMATVATGTPSVLGEFALTTMMRSTPTITTYNPFAAGNQIAASATIIGTSTALFTASPTRLSFTFTVPSGAGVGTSFGVHFTADSEL